LIAEARQIAENPCPFNEGQGILTIRSMKPTTRQARWNIILGMKVPASVTFWQQNQIT